MNEWTQAAHRNGCVSLALALVLAWQMPVAQQHLLPGGLGGRRQGVCSIRPGRRLAQDAVKGILASVTNVTTALLPTEGLH